MLGTQQAPGPGLGGFHLLSHLILNKAPHETWYHSHFTNKGLVGIPWWSRDWNSVLSLLGPGLITGRGTKIPQATQHSQNNNNNKK